MFCLALIRLTIKYTILQSRATGAEKKINVVYYLVHENPYSCVANVAGALGVENLAPIFLL